jgi:hypothetical protein
MGGIARTTRGEKSPGIPRHRSGATPLVLCGLAAPAIFPSGIEAVPETRRELGQKWGKTSRGFGKWHRPSRPPKRRPGGIRIGKRTRQTPCGPRPCTLRRSQSTAEPWARRSVHTAKKTKRRVRPTGAGLNQKSSEVDVSDDFRTSGLGSDSVHVKKNPFGVPPDSF